MVWGTDELTVTTAAKAISPMRRGMEIMRARAGMMGGGFFVSGGSGYWSSLVLGMDLKRRIGGGVGMVRKGKATNNWIKQTLSILSVGTSNDDDTLTSQVSDPCLAASPHLPWSYVTLSSVWLTCWQ